MRTIPETEIRIDHARSSGPGGQNVNKRDTKAVLRWNIGASSVFSDEEKDRIRAHAGNRVNAEDEIVISADDARSQAANRETVLTRLHDIVRTALAPRKKRKPTRPTRASKEKRLEAKRQRAQKKRRRRPPHEE